MKEIDVEMALKKLHYSHRWLEYGFVDDQMLNDQLRALESDSVGGLEHYRFDAFRKILTNLAHLDSLTIERFIELANLDEDQTMAEAALGLLARQSSLTQEQLDRLKEHPAFRDDQLQKIINRIQLSRELDTSNLTDEFINRIISMRDDSVQRKLVNRLDISREQLELLTKLGVNRAVRNLAGAKLRRFGKT